MSAWRPPDPHSDFDHDAIEDAIVELRRLDERALWAQVLEPFYQRRGYKVENVHNRGESEHGLDLLLELRLPGNHAILEGVQTKSKISLTTPSSAKDEIIIPYKKALMYKHPRPSGTEILLSTFFWITTGDVTSQGREGIRTHIEDQADIGSRIQVLDARDLIDQLIATNCHDLLQSLELGRYNTTKWQHQERDEGVFAAHCAYLAACWHLEQAERDSVANARDCLTEAVKLVDSDRRRSAYYYRTLRMYYAALEDLLGKFPDAWKAGGLSRSPEMSRHLNAWHPEGDRFVYATYHCLRQIENLEERYIGYSGLSSLQICNFVLRLGRSPILSTAIDKRIRDILDEMNAQDPPVDSQQMQLVYGRRGFLPLPRQLGHIAKSARRRFNLAPLPAVRSLLLQSTAGHRDQGQ